jgi:hypothetical protein
MKILLFLILLFFASFTAKSQSIWDGPNTIFSKAANEDHTQVSNQDKITELVILTRASTKGMFNIKSESSYTNNSSPTGTEWAFAGLNGNPQNGVTASNFSDLTFTNWENSLGGSGNLGDNIEQRAGVLHLITEDIYLNIKFTNWAQGNGGGGAFAYQRSTRETVSVKNDIDSNIKTYPQPAKNTLYLENFKSNKMLSVFNSTGQLVLNSTISDGQLDVSSLKSGLYYISI